jgi:2-keto-4-pentenoate hydratase/2-oxohepta-3-ene-1,7-dioic acid hydratase in catechol pathway
MSYEGELGLVISRRARHVTAAEAWDYIYGYTVINDITARDLQKKDGQWARAKGCDTFCPVGPYVVPKQGIVFDDLRIKSWVNDQPKQDGTVRDMIFNPGVIIEYISAFLTLEPGDLIATGTPPGVGTVVPGDRIRVEIEGVGTLENQVIAA